MESKETPQRNGGIVNYFQGATIHNIVINGNMNRSGTEHYSNKAEEESRDYTDEQVACALSRIVGTGRPIDSKQKWAGAMWLLRWRCNFPSKALGFCQRINALPFDEELEIKCEYNNIRQISTLSFMNQDARNLEEVQYSKNDEQIFFQMREVVVELEKELLKTKSPRMAV